MAVPMGHGYPSSYYPPQQVVYVERPVKKKKPKKRHKIKTKPKDLFEQYEADFESTYVSEEKSKKKGKHKVKDLFKSYEEEMEAFYPPLKEIEKLEEPKPLKKRGKHKMKKIEPLWVTPEDIPEEEDEDWMIRQEKQWKKQAEDFKRMSESGKKLALGTAKTFESAKRKARRFGRGLKGFYRQARMKLGMKVPKRPPVQVFIEPTEEGDYVVYGQVKRTEVPVMRPTRPIKVFTPPPKGEYIRYEELM